MKIEQFVMAYLVEQDKLRAMMPDDFESLRPVLRINAEIIDDKTGYVEFNTAAKRDDFKGWLNIAYWENVAFERQGQTVIFNNANLQISFKATNLQGGCPAEKDNDGCYFLDREPQLRQSEEITENKEFCDCEFSWKGIKDGAHGRSIGKTLPAIPSDSKNTYPHTDMTLEYAAAIPCEQVLGTYKVTFERIN